MKYRNKIFNNSGFTLAEALIVMFIICTVVAVATPAISKHIKKLGQSTAHGMYACYYNGTQLRQVYAGGDPTNVTTCTFKLRKSNSYYLIKAVGGGDANAPGQYVTHFVPRTDGELRITGGGIGQDMLIESKTTLTGSNWEEFIRAHGSKGTTPLYLDNVRGCALIAPIITPTSCTDRGRQTGCIKTSEPRETNPNEKIPVLKISNCTRDRYVIIETGQSYYFDNNGTRRKDLTFPAQNANRTYTIDGNTITIDFRDPSFPDTSTGSVSGLMAEFAAIGMGTNTAAACNNTTGANYPAIFRTLCAAQVGNRNNRGAVLIQW